VSDYYHDDPVAETAVGRILPKFIATAVLMVASYFFFQTTLAANIALNSNKTMEFGQSVSAAAACAGSNSLTVTPKSSFVNQENGGGSYYLASVQVEGIPASCNGKSFSLSFYDDVPGSSALPIFSYQGVNKSVANVYSQAGYFVPGFQSSGLEVSSASGAFTVSFKTPVALSTNAMKVTLQSTEYKAWAESTITSSQEHTCILLETSGVKCWGVGGNGEMGTGLTDNRSTPIAPTGLSSGVIQIAAGTQFTCAVLNTGTAQCWGINGRGQLGDNSQDTRYSPVNVLGLSGVTAIATGYQNTCALLSSGGVKCWGRNTEGNVGNGSTVGQTDVGASAHYRTPQDVSGLSSGVTAIAAGKYHTCALLSSGGVKCWGYNLNGPLGDGTYTSSNVPVNVSSLSSDVIQIAAGQEHTCAVLSTGQVKCWGLNTYGALGNGGTTRSNVPVTVNGISNAIRVAAGGNHSCAVLSTGAVKCWGFGGNGNLGDGGVDNDFSPVVVADLSGVKAVGIATGQNHSCALLSTGAAKCWGYGQQGQLGHGIITNAVKPVNVTGIP
jgi:alpha-tubulin suppressor-like RCC1 family protein